MSKTRHAWIVTLSVDLGILIFVPLRVKALTQMAALAVVWISLLLMQLVVLFSLARKSKKIEQPIPISFYWKAGSIVLVVGIVASVLAVCAAVTPGSELNLAQSNMPLNVINPAQKRLVVGLLRKDIAATEANDKFIQNEKTVSPAIYTPESFASIATMQNVVSQLQNAVAVDEHYAQQLKDNENDFRQQMAATDADYLRSWDASRKEAVQANEATLRLQGQWWAGFTQLYTYAEANTQQIAVRNGKLVITNTAVRDLFNQQFDANKQIYNEYLAALQKATEIKKKDSL